MKQHIGKYLLFYVINVVIINVVLYKYLTRNFKTEEKINGNLIEKLAYYKAHKYEYKVIFIGDSRTYTNIHDPMIDSVLGLRSINLAMWANWFPTQYPFYQDILPQIPEGSIIVWSIGHQNFTHTTDFDQLEETYPIGIKNVKEYHRWGFTLYEVSKNIKKYDLSPVLLTQPEWMKFWVKSILDKKLKEIDFNNSSHNNVNNQTEPIYISKLNELQSTTSNNSDVLLVKPVMNGDTVSSAEVYWKQGNYWRVEFDSLFFRRKQRADKAQRLISAKKEYVADNRYIENFYAIVDLLKPYNKKLRIIVNEFEEAPYVYNAGEKEKYEKMMTSVRSYLKAQGFTLTKVDFTDFKNSDYFDFNHMNNKGTLKYTQKFASILKQELAF